MKIKTVLRKPASFVRLAFHKYAWRKQNRHNDTEAINYFTRSNVKVGKHTYGPIEVLYDTGAVKVTIGNYCSIAKAVKMFGGGGVHDYHRISTFPFQTKVYHGIGNSSRNEALDIVIEDDVWIGYDCIILPGAHIGKGSVIGARSVVTGNIPPYSIYVGNKVIKKRFSNEIVDLIADIDFSRIEHRAGDAYEQFCMQRVNPKNISEIKKTFAE